jgi:hypothetical protein
LGELTLVVRTPQFSGFSKVGLGALGVSTNSNSDSLPLELTGFDILEDIPSLGVRYRAKCRWLCSFGKRHSEGEEGKSGEGSKSSVVGEFQDSLTASAWSMLPWNWFL